MISMSTNREFLSVIGTKSTLALTGNTEVASLYKGFMGAIQAHQAEHTGVPGRRPVSSRSGLAYGLAAYGLWGLVPLYFKAIARVPPLEVLAHRVVWSVLVLGCLISWGRRWRELARCLRSRAVMPWLMSSTLLIALNWFTFIYGVSTNQILQTSLGYFMTPLVNVLLGQFVLRERLRGGQWCAVALAAVGVLILGLWADTLPWIALTLAASFGLYGLLRKAVAVDGPIGLSVETLLLLPFALAFLVYRAGTGELAWGALDRTTDGLLLLSGPVTTIPLLFFVQAARRLPLATLGFLQYLAPTLAFIIATVVYGEPFTRVQLSSFACIWTALVLYSVDSWLAYRGRGQLSVVSCQESEVREQGGQQKTAM
jgi:chloramphenicol-sensitive protein RarD